MLQGPAEPEQFKQSISLSGNVLPRQTACGIAALQHKAVADGEAGGRCMALSLAPHNIRVNAIGPGSIMTPILAAVANDRAAMNRWALAEFPTLTLASMLLQNQAVLFFFLEGCLECTLVLT